jgi:hypothetical protein
MSFRPALNAALFSGAFAVTCAGISSVVPLDHDIPVVSEKLKWLSEKGAKYDTLFVGSSRVFHQILPSVFDARMAELGHSVSSFNMGADGMNFPETLHAIQLASKRLPRLKTIVVELGNMQRVVADKSRRSEYWHTGRHTLAVVRSIWSDKTEPTEKKAAQTLEHISLFARASTCLGKGQEWLGRLTLPAKARSETIGEEGCVAVNRRMSATYTALFTDSLAKRKAGANGVIVRDSALEELLSDFIERMSRAGVQVIFVKLPAFRKFAPTNPNAVVLDLDDVDRFPEVWSAEHRYDPAHLNATGAAILSKLLANEFAEKIHTRD